MHITKIELEDIKSHKESKFEFERGTTAISGENGSGKTTLIEAVAWTLFDLLDYKKDDFVRRGAKKGVVRVTFESGLDERRYVVHRDSGTGYYVYDPKLKTRIADKKEEVTRFLWQHLGVEPGTDLEALFRRAIGVPQGTFTAIFLESPTERKKAFDKLLKVEEYRQGADKLRETVRYIDGQIVTAREKIARAEGELARLEQLETDLEFITKDLKTLNESFENLEKEVSERGETVKNFDEVEKKVNELKIEFDKFSNERSRAEVVLSNKEKEKINAKKASEKIKEVEEDYKIHLDALGKLKEFERERNEREKLNKELAKIDNAIVNVKADEKTTRENLEKIANAHKEVEGLKDKAVEQKDLEKKRDELAKEIAKIEQVNNSIKSLEAKIVNLRKQHSENKKEIEYAEANKEKGDLFAEHQKRDEEIKNQLSDFRAKLANEQQFQDKVKNNLCPILLEKCQNVAAKNETLESYIKQQTGNFEAEIETLEIKQRDVAVVVKEAKKAENAAAALPTLLKRKEEIVAEGKNLRDEQDLLKEQVKNVAENEKEFSEIKSNLNVLGSPKEKIKLLEKEIAKEISFREKITEIESNLERLNNDRGIIIERLESYKDLDFNWKTYSEKRDETANAHREFLSNETLAKSLPEKLKEFEAAQKEIENLSENLKKAEAEFETVNKDYDREKHYKERNDLIEIQNKRAETKANLEHATRREAEIDKELKRLKAVKLLMQEDFIEKEKLEKVGEATAFIRSTLKEAAPQVAKNYVYHVSIEANQMFREITGNAEHTLRWTEDYGIVLEEDGYERPFQNLSGGEQMSAALAVRLALLKQLSDVRIAFFDEPTTNMDIERRERLAEQISQITEKQTFDQLFVISHDDTFEGYVDNVITIRAEEDGE